MKHIIKKILREEFNDFDYFNEIEPFNDFDYFNEIEPSHFDEWLYKKNPELVNTIGLFLKNYENLKPIVKGDKTLYVDENDLPIFYYYQDEKNGYTYFKYSGFWEVFEDENHMKYTEIQEVMKVWLELTYNLGELKPRVNASFQDVFAGTYL